MEEQLIQLENEIWDRLKEATECKDADEISNLNKILSKLQQMKFSLELIRQECTDLQDLIYNKDERKIARILVTEGACNNSYLTMTDVINKNLCPPDDRDIIVEMDNVEVVTNVNHKIRRLKDRKNIRIFMSDNIIAPGDYIIWEEIEKNVRYRIMLEIIPE